MYYELDGEKIFASNGGVEHKPGQPTIVFVHGAGMDNTIWVLYNRFFARAGFNTLAIDLPGHGKSAGDALDSVEEMASWLNTLLAHSGLQNISLVGHSLGSLVALQAASAGDTIDKLVLLGTACPMPVGEALLDAARNNRHAAVDMIMLFGHAYKAQLGGNPVAGIDIVNSSMRLLERALDGTLFIDLNACNNYGKGLQAAQNVRASTTLILGEEDKMTPPASARDLLEKLASPELVTLKNCGHMMLSEQPEQVHRALVHALEPSES